MVHAKFMRVFRFSYGENMKNPCKTTEKSNHPAGRTFDEDQKNMVNAVNLMINSNANSYSFVHKSNPKKSCTEGPGSATIR